MALPQQVETAGKAADDALSAINPAIPPTEEPKSVPGAADTVESLKVDLEKEQHKYSVLQGKYNAEIEPLKGDVNILNDLKGKLKAAEKAAVADQGKVAKLVTQNAEFVRQNKNLQTQLDSKKIETDTTGEVDVTKLLSEEDLETLHVEGIDGTAIDIITKLVGKLTQSKSTVEAPSTESTPGKQTEDEKKVINDFWDGIDSAIPNWSAINKTPEFVNWLSELAPYHKGKTRHELLTTAQEDWDLDTVLTMFREFMASDGYKPEPEKAPAKETPPEPDKITPPEQSLEKQVEPDRSQHVDINLDPTASKALINSHDGKSQVDVGYVLNPKAQVKSSDIALFYKDATQTNGLRITNPELYTQIDAAILKAGAEKRVIQQ